MKVLVIYIGETCVQLLATGQHRRRRRGESIDFTRRGQKELRKRPEQHQRIKNKQRPEAGIACP
jgi:hypothetical protein